MIRSAIPEDAPEAVPLIVEAIGSIALVLTGTQVLREAIPILERAIRIGASHHPTFWRAYLLTALLLLTTSSTCTGPRARMTLVLP